MNQPRRSAIVKLMCQADPYFDMDRQESQKVWDSFNAMDTYEHRLRLMVASHITDRTTRMDMIFEVSKVCQKMKLDLCQQAQEMDRVACLRFYERQDALAKVRELRDDVLAMGNLFGDIDESAIEGVN